MLAATFAQVTQVPFVRPTIDWHAVAPELLLLFTGAIVTIVRTRVAWISASARASPPASCPNRTMS